MFFFKSKKKYRKGGKKTTKVKIGGNKWKCDCKLDQSVSGLPPPSPSPPPPSPSPPPPAPSPPPPSPSPPPPAPSPPPAATAAAAVKKGKTLEEIKGILQKKYPNKSPAEIQTIITKQENKKKAVRSMKAQGKTKGQISQTLKKQNKKAKAKKAKAKKAKGGTKKTKGGTRKKKSVRNKRSPRKNYIIF